MEPEWMRLLWKQKTLTDQFGHAKVPWKLYKVKQSLGMYVCMYVYDVWLGNTATMHATFDMHGAIVSVSIIIFFLFTWILFVCVVTRGTPVRAWKKIC